MADDTVHAPEISWPGMEWFNIASPLSLADVRGKLVILDFWTTCCINCMHVLSSLRRVEEAFPEEVVVIGVHSPKFAAERNAANLREAVARYGIVHPVVNDPDMVLWREYGVRAWPTLVFVSPDGAVIGLAPGEPDPELLLRAVGNLIEEAKTDGKLDPGALKLISAPRSDGRLAYPGQLKPLAGAGGARHWVLADGGHNQIVELDNSGAEMARFGSGEAGLLDGSAERAQFNSPQGLIATPDSIYVADTFNHAIRKIDRASGAVTTLAGTGVRGPVLNGAVAGRQAALASVWDLEISGSQLYFSNAGTHQLGVLDLDNLEVRALAGTGGEDLQDGPASEALLAQPSGLALSPDGTVLGFADSETSAIRRLHLDNGGRVDTLVGTGLFDFAHANGPLGEARFQHPLGLGWLDGTRVLVADSFNSSVRLIDLDAGEVRDFDSYEFVCQDSVCLPLAEPAAVIADGSDRVLVVDTNNHRVVEYCPSKNTYRTWAQ